MIHGEAWNLRTERKKLKKIAYSRDVVAGQLSQEKHATHLHAKFPPPPITEGTVFTGFYFWLQLTFKIVICIYENF
jgi:hypothetical protein